MRGRSGDSAGEGWARAEPEAAPAHSPAEARRRGRKSSLAPQRFIAEANLRGGDPDGRAGDWGAAPGGPEAGFSRPQASGGGPRPCRMEGAIDVAAERREVGAVWPATLYRGA